MGDYKEQGRKKVVGWNLEVRRRCEVKEVTSAPLITECS